MKKSIKELFGGTALPVILCSALLSQGAFAEEAEQSDPPPENKGAELASEQPKKLVDIYINTKETSSGDKQYQRCFTFPDTDLTMCSMLYRTYDLEN